MVSDLYGFKTGPLPARRVALETVFSTSMVPHESSYLGEYDQLRLASGARLRLQPNRDPDDPAALAEEDFPEHAVLLYVEAKEDADELRDRLLAGIHGVEFLQRETVTPDRRFLRIRRKAGRDVVVLEKRLEAAVPAAVRGG
jgi:hypothetical protein